MRKKEAQPPLVDEFADKSGLLSHIPAGLLGTLPVTPKTLPGTPPFASIGS